MEFKQKTKIVINGKEYSSFEDLPPEIREKIKARLSKITPGIVGKALLKNLLPAMAGRPKELPKRLIEELLGNDLGDSIDVSFGPADSKTAAAGDPGQPPPQPTADYVIDRSPTVQPAFESSGKLAIPILIAAAAALLYFFRGYF